MRLKTDSTAFVLLLAFLTSIGPLSTDIFLPSLPSIRAVFGTSAAGAQATLTGYFIGFALAQAIYGPISDRIGRRTVLLVGLVAYTFAAAVCIFARSIEVLVIARIVQAVAAAAPMILARTIVRDLYAGVRAGQLLSVMASIMGIMPIVAPVVGGFLEVRYGWRSTFVVMTASGVLAFAMVALVLPETLREPRAERLSVGSILASYAVVARSAAFRAYAALVCLSYAGLITYIGVSSFIMQGRYRLSPAGFGLTFATSALAFVAGTFLGRFLAGRLGLDRTIGVGTGFLAVGGVLLPVGVAFGPGNAAEFVLPMTIYMIGIGVVVPQALAAALTPFPERAGAASSLIGLLHMSVGAFFLILAGVVFGEDTMANATVLGGSGVAALVVYLATGKARNVGV